MTAKNPLYNKQLKQNISSLEGEMNSMHDQLDLNPEDLLVNDDLLPGLNDIQLFDYDKEIESIKEDSKITLECLSSLYLDEETIEKKNINNIIQNDAQSLAELNFSLSCSKRGLINLMKQLDLGINDPLMYQAVGTFQKEIRDTIKMIYDIQKKMKDFYKDIREELKELNTGEDVEDNNVEDVETEESYHVVDMDKLNDEIDSYMNRGKGEKK